jgi:glycosyltransferase involved in cell wall biosynthesis
MKILHANFHKGWGGQSNRILIVSKELQKKGHEVIISAPAESELLKRANNEGIKGFDGARFRRGFAPFSLYNDIIKIRSLIEKERFDIIHTHGSQDSWAAALAMSFVKNRPILIRTKHNIFPIKDHAANRWLYGKATDKIICISRAICDYCVAKPYIAPEKLTLIHSAVDGEKFERGNRDRFRTEWKLEGKFAAGITGRLCQEKGHRVLFQAVREIRDRIPELMLLVVGTGNLYQKLKEYAREQGIADRVVFTGFRKDIPDVLSGLDLFLMPSLSEGLGTAVLEAAAAGLPIIASNIGGIPDIIESGKNGLLVPSGKPGALAEGIFSLYSNPEKALSYGSKAREYVNQNFSESALGNKTEETYLDLIRKRNGHPAKFGK